MYSMNCAAGSLRSINPESPDVSFYPLVFDRSHLSWGLGGVHSPTWLGRAIHRAAKLARWRDRPLPAVDCTW